MTGQRTYWHLLGRRRMPSEYEVVSSKLLYHPERGFEIDGGLGGFYDRFGRGSPLRCRDWERFQDPRQTTYRRYTRLALSREHFVDGLFELVEQTGYDRGLSPVCLSTFERAVAPLRYPWHALQLVAAYVAQMAPSGRITMAALFQAADELRRVQRVVHRTALLQRMHPTVADDVRSTWERDPMWQPARELVERLLVAYDWGEALVALQLVVKPHLDELFLRGIGDLAQRQGDPLLAELFFSFGEDCEWHRQWSRALIGLALDDRPDNRDVVHEWIARWHPLAARAVEAFAPLLERAAAQPSIDELSPA